MTITEFRQHAAACTHFSSGHYGRSISERMRAIADSPYADYRPDGYGRGGFVEDFEKELAELFGKQAAVFMPSGTMAQPIALRVWADRAGIKTVAFHPTCHLELHEHQGYRHLHGLDAVLVGDAKQLFTLEDLQAVEQPLSTLLIELPQREIGGQLPTWNELESITDFARSKGWRLHLDGARIWECQPYYDRPYSEIVAGFDSVYASFYKIFAGLPGAVLAGPTDFIDEARIWMRRQGGNLVNMFPGAIAGKLGMDLHLARLPEYSTKAAEIAAILRELPGVRVVPDHPPTNMMHLFFDAPREDVLDAVGQIAEREKCLLLHTVTAMPTGGSRYELWVGNAGLDIPEPRLRSLFTEMMNILSHR